MGTLPCLLLAPSGQTGPNRGLTEELCFTFRFRDRVSIHHPPGPETLDRFHGPVTSAGDVDGTARGSRGSSPSLLSGEVSHPTSNINVPPSPRSERFPGYTFFSFNTLAAHPLYVSRLRH